MTILNDFQSSNLSLWRKHQIAALIVSVIGISTAYLTVFTIPVSVLAYVSILIAFCVTWVGIGFLVRFWWLSSIEKKFVTTLELRKIWLSQSVFAVSVVVAFHLYRAGIFTWIILAIICSLLALYWWWLEQWGVAQEKQNKRK